MIEMKPELQELMARRASRGMVVPDGAGRGANMRVWAAAALGVVMSAVFAEAQPQKPFDPNMDYDEMQRQYLPGMMRELQSDKKKQQAFIRDCVKMMTVTFISECKKNIASLDTSACNPGLANRRQAEKSCRAMVQGQAVQWETDSKGRYEPRTR